MRYRDRVHDVKIADIEVGGDIHRIILSGIKVPPQKSAFDVRQEFLCNFDALRRIMLSYPYGIEDMCADLIFESSHADAGYAHIIMECMGYPYFSGSNTMATIAALLEYGYVPAGQGMSDIKLETPSGVIAAQYRIDGEVIEEIVVEGDAAYVIKDANSVRLPDAGSVDYALVWSGACFIMVEADAFGIKLEPEYLSKMKETGYALTEAIKQDFHHEHPDLGRIDPPMFVNFMGEFKKTGDLRYRGRGAIYGHPATVFYCPTGTGTAARMALSVSRGQMEPDAVFESISAAGNKFTGRGLRLQNREGYNMLTVNVAAKPFVLATTTMHLDFGNPLMEGFLKLREIVES